MTIGQIESESFHYSRDLNAFSVRIRASTVACQLFVQLQERVLYEGDDRATTVA